MGPPPSQSFTLQFNGIANVLVDDDVKLSEAYNPASGLPQPQLHQFRGIWDTGASNSVISRRVVNALGIQPIGQVQTRTANGLRQASVYLVNIYLRNMVAFHGIRVTEGDLVGNEDVLIGMDVIANGDFSITGCDGKTCFSFRAPSMKRIDYVEEFSREQQKRAPSPEAARKARNKAKRQRQGRR